MTRKTIKIDEVTDLFIMRSSHAHNEVEPIINTANFYLTDPNGEKYELIIPRAEFKIFLGLLSAAYKTTTEDQREEMQHDDHWPFGEISN